MAANAPASTKAPPMSEAALQAVVLDALRAYRWRFVHFRPAQLGGKTKRWVTAYTGDDGFPDIIAVKDGRQLVLECKGTRGAKKPGAGRTASQLERRMRYEAQEKWIAGFAAAGAYAVFVTPTNLDVVLEEIAE